MITLARQVTTFIAILVSAVSIPTWNARANEFLLDGNYVVVALRRASDVISSPKTDADAFSPGDTVSFGETLTWLDGITCESWRAEVTGDVGFTIGDPNLSDLTVAPLDVSSGQSNNTRSIELLCNGDHLTDITQVDSRVIVVQSPAGAMYAILEKPLDTGQIERLQFVLKDMKFYDGAITGEMDEATRRAVSYYADYRGAEYVFKNAAITENLLDGLQILASN